MTVPDGSVIAGIRSHPIENCYKWFESLALEQSQRECVERELIRIIDNERQDAGFIISVKATIITGRRAE